MAHDRNGTPLQVGDRVTLEARVTGISPGGGANLTLETLGTPRSAGEYHPTIAISSSLVQRQAGAAAAAATTAPAATP